MTKCFPSLLMTLPACLLASCAAILSGGQDMVTINSTVKDVRILIDGELRGTTSVSTPIRRSRKQHSIRIEHDDYMPVEAALETRLDGRMLFGLLIDFGILTIPIDLLTGNAYTLSAGDYTVLLDGDRLVLDNKQIRMAATKAANVAAQPEGQRKSWSTDPSGGTLGKR